MSWVATGMALAQAGYGIYQSQKGAKAAREAEANRPEYEIPESIRRAMMTAELRSMQGLPSEVKSQMTQQMDRSRMSSLAQINERRGGLGAIAQLEQQQQDAIRQQASMDVQQREKNLLNLQNMRMKMAEQEQTRWQWDEQQKYEEQLAKGQAMQGAGMQNIAGGVTSLGTIAASGAYGDMSIGGADKNILTGKGKEAYNAGIESGDIPTGTSFGDWRTEQRTAGTYPGRDLLYKTGEFLRGIPNIQGGTGLNTIETQTPDISGGPVLQPGDPGFIGPLQETNIQGKTINPMFTPEGQQIANTPQPGDPGFIGPLQQQIWDGTSPLKQGDISPTSGATWDAASGEWVNPTQPFGTGLGVEQTAGQLKTVEEGGLVLPPEHYNKPGSGLGLIEPGGAINVSGPSLQSRLTIDTSPSTAEVEVPELPGGGIDYTLDPVTGAPMFSEEDREAAKQFHEKKKLSIQEKQPQVMKDWREENNIPDGQKLTKKQATEFGKHEQKLYDEGYYDAPQPGEPGFVGPLGKDEYDDTVIKSKEQAENLGYKVDTTGNVIQPGDPGFIGPLQKEITGPSLKTESGENIPLGNDGQIDYEALDIPESDFPEAPLFYHANGNPWNNNLDTFKEVGKLGGIMDGKHVLFDKDGNRILPDKNGLPMSPADSQLRFDFMELPALEQQKIEVEYDGDMDRYFQEQKEKREKEETEGRIERHRNEMHAIANYGKPVSLLTPHEVETTLKGINSNSSLSIAMKNSKAYQNFKREGSGTEFDILTASQFPLQSKYS